MEIEDIKNLSIVLKPVVEPLIKTFIQPKIDKLQQWVKKQNLKSEVANRLFENKFQNYLVQTYKDCLMINVLVFPNQQIKLKEIYQPLTIRSTKDHKSFKIDKDPRKLLKEYDRILISDTAGMGKSTLMKWITLSIIDTSLFIPIRIELNKINNENTIIEEIFKQIDPIDQSFDKDLIIKFLELGSFCIILDGFDETPQSDRDFVLERMKSLISKAPKNNFIITSRPEPELTSFGSFQSFNISNLKKDESLALLEKYDQSSSLNIYKDLETDINQNLNQVKEILVNPFLVSLLYKTYSYNKNIPSRKSTFYNEVYSALFKHHDLSKNGFRRDKKSKLDIYEFRLVLRRLAFETAKQSETEYSINQLTAHLEIIKKKLITLDFKTSYFIEDLESSVALFLKEGIHIKWAHKSFQDYFAAEFICAHEKKNELISKLVSIKNASYINIIDFIIELEPQCFRKNIEFQILNKFNDFWNNRYQEFKLNEEVISKRKSINFGYTLGIVDGENSKFQDYINLFENKENVHKEYMPYSLKIGPKNNRTLFEIYGITYDQMILNLIGAKRNNNYLKLIKGEKNIRNKDLKIRIPKTSPNFMDDSKSNPMNKLKSFDTLTKWLISSLSRPSQKNYQLDPQKALKEMEKIQEEINTESKIDLMEGF